MQGALSSKDLRVTSPSARGHPAQCMKRESAVLWALAALSRGLGHLAPRWGAPSLISSWETAPWKQLSLHPRMCLSCASSHSHHLATMPWGWSLAPACFDTHHIFSYPCPQGLKLYFTYKGVLISVKINRVFGSERPRILLQPHKRMLLKHTMQLIRPHNQVREWFVCYKSPNSFRSEQPPALPQNAADISSSDSGDKALRITALSDVQERTVFHSS